MLIHGFGSPSSHDTGVLSVPLFIVSTNKTDQIQLEQEQNIFCSDKRYA